MISYPIEQAIPDIRQALLDGNRLVLVAPPGAGKTTLVPLALLSEPWLTGRMIILLEPRRLAARNAAARMAALLGENTGETVGYRIRAENCTSERTRILVVTEGILTRMLQADPELATAALVIFDEFHERSLHADLSLAFSLQSQELLRPDLRLLVMSATLDAAGVARLLDDAPVLTSEGQAFPVETSYLPDKAPLPEPGRIATAVLRRLERVLAEKTGSVLVFLPGVREIKQVEHALDALPPGKLQDMPIVAALYGDLSREQQDRAIQPCAVGRRKIVLATNIAETSLTIEGISVVVDSGLERQARFDPGSGMNRLETVFISRDSADQRSGRAGSRANASACGQRHSNSTWHVTAHPKSCAAISHHWHWNWPTGACARAVNCAGWTRPMPAPLRRRANCCANSAPSTQNHASPHMAGNC